MIVPALEVQCKQQYSHHILSTCPPDDSINLDDSPHAKTTAYSERQKSLRALIVSACTMSIN